MIAKVIMYKNCIQAIDSQKDILALSANINCSDEITNLALNSLEGDFAAA